MSIEPGYDFGINEEVSAVKLTTWVTGADLNGQISAVSAGLAITSLGTGPTTISLAEGALFFNSSTGNVEVQSRFGHIPLLGGSQMHSRRLKCHYETLDDQEQRFYGPICVGVAALESSYSCGPAAMEADWWNYSPARTGGIVQFGNYGIVQPGALQPTIDNPGTGYTETFYDESFHRCIQMRGWTPMIYSAVSTYTSPFTTWDYRSIKGPTGYEQGTDVYGSGTVQHGSHVFNDSYVGWAGKYSLYLEPCLPSLSFNKGTLLKNTRV
jgi:hypothetical protein